MKLKTLYIIIVLLSIYMNCVPIDVKFSIQQPIEGVSTALVSTTGELVTEKSKTRELTTKKPIDAKIDLNDIVQTKVLEIKFQDEQNAKDVAKLLTHIQVIRNYIVWVPVQIISLNEEKKTISVNDQYLNFFNDQEDVFHAIAAAQKAKVVQWEDVKGVEEDKYNFLAHPSISAEYTFLTCSIEKVVCSLVDGENARIILSHPHLNNKECTEIGTDENLKTFDDWTFNPNIVKSLTVKDKTVTFMWKNTKFNFTFSKEEQKQLDEFVTFGRKHSGHKYRKAMKTLNSYYLLIITTFYLTH
jgi:hypothetical protein